MYKSVKQSSPSNVFTKTTNSRLYKNMWRQMAPNLHNVFWEFWILPVATQSEYWRSRSTVPSVTTSLTLLGLVEPMGWEVVAGP